MTPKMSVRTIRWIAVAALPVVLACGASDAVGVSVTSNTSQTLAVPAGRQFSITLGTVGGGDYSAPPSITSDAVRYISVSDVEPHVPAGPRQRFVFDAAAPGTAVIHFTHTGTSPAVEDTVVVR